LLNAHVHFGGRTDIRRLGRIDKKDWLMLRGGKGHILLKNSHTARWRQILKNKIANN